MINQLFKGIFLSMAFVSLIAISCNDDDSFDDSVIPEFPDFPTSISSAPGYEFLFEGLVKDDIGIETVEIQYLDWYLDKVIQFDDAPKEYMLKYKFLVPEEEDPGSSHTIKVSVTNLAGNKVTHDVVVSLDLDVTVPEIDFIEPVSGTAVSKGEKINVKVSFKDDKGLDSVFLYNNELGLDLKMKLSDAPVEYLLEQEVEIPADGIEGSIVLNAKAKDLAGNQMSAISNILVGEKNEIHEMYAVGGSVWWEWDVEKASQMWKDPENEDWWVFEFYYWTGYGIKFVGQLDWAPNNWGLDPNDPSKIINSEDSQVLEFDEGDGYYRVRFNPYTLEYSYEKMVVDVEVKNEMYIVGNGYPDYPGLDWNPDGAIKMDADPWGNPYVFTAWIQISDDTSFKFIGQNDGWSPFDCGFEIGGEVQLPLNYAKNVAGSGTADLKFKGQAGWYYINFDYFLLRTTIHRYDP